MADPTAVAGVPFYAGCVSQLGILLWCTTATTIWLTCSILGGCTSERRETRRFLLLAGYLLLGVVFVWSSRSEILRGEYALFLLALGASGSFRLLRLHPKDLYVEVNGLQKAETLIEEGSKLMGIATWLAFCVRYASRRFRRPEQGPWARSASAPVLCPAGSAG